MEDNQMRTTWSYQKPLINRIMEAHEKNKKKELTVQKTNTQQMNEFLKQRTIKEQSRSEKN